MPRASGPIDPALAVTDSSRVWRALDDLARPASVAEIVDAVRRQPGGAAATEATVVASIFELRSTGHVRAVADKYELAT